MAISIEKRKALLEANIGSSNEVRAALEDYLARTGLTARDFAARISYSLPSLNLFRTGKYYNISGTDGPIRAAIMDFIRTHPIDAPGAAQGKLYETQNVKLIRRYFRSALDRGWAYVVHGGPGSQKSFVAEHLVAELNRQELSKNGHGRRGYYIYCPANVRPTDLMKCVAEACGTIGIGNAQRIIRNLRFDFRSRRAVLVFDEAQHLSAECFEVVRELLDRPPHFGLLFLGSHDLDLFFIKHALDLEQWNSRFHASTSLPGISEEEAASIIRAELGACPEAKVNRLIAGAHAADLRQGSKRTYISARRLFEAINEIKAARQAQEAKSA